MKTAPILFVLAALLAAGACSAAQPTDAQRSQMREQLRARVQAADTDRDGAISRAEAQAGLPRLAERFDDLDADGDGRLTRAEMQSLAAALRDRGGR